MTNTVTPFLMFEGRAEEALKFYVSVIPNSRIIDIERYSADGPGAEGSVRLASFSVGGLTIMCIDSAVRHAFGFTPSTSLFVNCASVAELDRIAAMLVEDGEFLMQPADHGFSLKFAWLTDRFGVSWQLNCE